MAVAVSMHLQLLGTFALRAGARVVLDESWKRGKAKGLLKLVALAPGHRLHREQVTEALWAELDPDAAMNQLFKSLHFLKTELARYGRPSPLSMIDQHVCLDRAIGVDTDRFRKRAQDAERATLPFVVANIAARPSTHHAAPVPGYRLRRVGP